jgi:beta-N-acetylhexosaminidase
MDKKKIILISLFALSFFIFLPFTNINNDSLQTSSEINLRNCLGEVFVVGISGHKITEEEEVIMKRLQPGGVILYSRNFKDYNQFKTLIGNIRGLVGHDIFIMIDEEPGGAQRLGVFDGGFTNGIPKWEVINRGADKLKDLGIDVNLAPVLDYPFDKSTFIRKRIPVKDIDNFRKFNRSFISILKEKKMIATLKHFPGMGFFNDDPHIKIPQQSIDDKTFNDSLLLFRDGIDAGAEFVMSSHAIYENIDKDYIATFSSKIINDLLIEEMRFNGLVITDDLSDMPVSNQDNTHSAIGIMALQAGHHLITYSHQLERTAMVYDEILSQIMMDKVLEESILNKCKAIKEFKGHYFEKNNNDIK